MSETTTISSAVPTWTRGNRLWRARRHADLTQQQLAERLGIGLKSVKDYEADRRSPKRGVLLGWAVACQVDPSWLEHGNDTAAGTERAVTRGYRTHLALA